MLTYPIYHYHHFLEVTEEVDSRAADAARNAQIQIILNECEDMNNMLNMSELGTKYNIPPTTLFRWEK